VRFKVKAGREQQFLDAHNKVAFAWPGLRQVNIIKTGEHTFCVIAEWIDMDAIVNARASMPKFASTQCMSVREKSHQPKLRLRHRPVEIELTRPSIISR